MPCKTPKLADSRAARTAKGAPVPVSGLPHFPTCGFGRPNPPPQSFRAVHGRFGAIRETPNTPA